MVASVQQAKPSVAPATVLGIHIRFPFECPDRFMRGEGGIKVHLVHQTTIAIVTVVRRSWLERGTVTADRISGPRVGVKIVPVGFVGVPVVIIGAVVLVFVRDEAEFTGKLSIVFERCRGDGCGELGSKDGYLCIEFVDLFGMEFKDIVRTFFAVLIQIIYA